MVGDFLAAVYFFFDHWATVTMVCMKLHNLCIDRNVAVPNHRFAADVREEDEWVVYNNARKDDMFLRGRASGDHRHDITAKLEQLGMVRPVHAQCNSCTN